MPGQAGLPASVRAYEVRLVVVLTQAEYDALVVKDPEALQAGTVLVDGEGISSSAGTGTLSAQASTIEGAGASSSTGSGVLEAKQITVSGVGVSSSTGTGTLISGLSVVVGSSGPASLGLFVGDRQVVALYLGETEVTKAYLGENLL